MRVYLQGSDQVIISTIIRLCVLIKLQTTLSSLCLLVHLDVILAHCIGSPCQIVNSLCWDTAERNPAIALNHPFQLVMQQLQLFLDEILLDLWFLAFEAVQLLLAEVPVVLHVSLELFNNSQQMVHHFLFLN